MQIKCIHLAQKSKNFAFLGGSCQVDPWSRPGVSELAPIKSYKTLKLHWGLTEGIKEFAACVTWINIYSLKMYSGFPIPPVRSPCNFEAL